MSITIYQDDSDSYNNKVYSSDGIFMYNNSESDKQFGFRIEGDQNGFEWNVSRLKNSDSGVLTSDLWYNDDSFTVNFAIPLNGGIVDINGERILYKSATIVDGKYQANTLERCNMMTCYNYHVSLGTRVILLSSSNPST